MSSSHLAGIALIGVALFDVALAYTFLGSRIPEASRRRTVQRAVTISSMLFFGLGVWLLARTA